MVVWLFLAVPWVCLLFVIVVFPDHTQLIFFWLLVVSMYAWSVYKIAAVAAFCIYAQSGEDAAKRGGLRQCIK